MLIDKTILKYLHKGLPTAFNMGLVARKNPLSGFQTMSDINQLAILESLDIKLEG